MGLFSKGDIAIQLKKYNFNPGEKIEGTMRLNLKKPMQAKELSVSLIGKRIDRYMTSSGLANTNSRKEIGHKSSSEIVHRFKQPVSGSQEYHKDEFDFSLFIPPDILDRPEEVVDKVTKDLQNTVSAIKVITGGTTHTKTQLKWVVKARLALPGLDITRGQDITLTKPI